MGDLKKKIDYIVEQDNEPEILIENDAMINDDIKLNKLREYMKEFYQIQKNKEEKRKDNGNL